MDVRQEMKMRHTVTVGMSCLEISKQKVFEIEWNENVRNDS